jgi:hypothetical protein
MKKVPHCPSQQQFKLDTTINFRRTDKALNGFLGAQLDQRRSAEELACKESERSRVVMIGVWPTTDVCHHIVTDHKGRRDEKPNKAFQDVVDDEVTAFSAGDSLPFKWGSPGHHNQEQTDVHPAEQSELLAQVLSLEVGDEADKTWSD